MGRRTLLLSHELILVLWRQNVEHAGLQYVDDPIPDDATVVWGSAGDGECQLVLESPQWDGDDYVNPLRPNLRLVEDH